jgi:hypothetical protein
MSLLSWLSLASILLLSYLLSLASLLLLALLLFYPPENIEVRDVPFFPSAVFSPAVADVLADAGAPLVPVVCGVPAIMAPFVLMTFLLSLVLHFSLLPGCCWRT